MGIITQPRGTLLRWTRFKSDPHGTGPEKRSAQIHHLCADAGFNISDMAPPSRLPRMQAWLSGLSARWRFGENASVDSVGFGLLGFRARFYRTALQNHSGIRVLLWETTYDSLLPTFAKAAGYRVIALPHNLEALVSEHAFADPSHPPCCHLPAEIARLGLSDALFTISREEQWFLEANNLLPSYLPFFPDPSLALECLAIRETRAARAQNDGSLKGPLLLLGSGFNPATARGMRQQLTWLTKQGSTTDILVAGPSTDRELADFNSPKIKIFGGVSRAHLVELLKTCSALLIHTRGGAGAVTRIPEALLAGVPLIANANAARDQHGVPGVHEYEAETEFLSLASTPLPIPPTPPRPVQAETRFLNILQQLAKPRTSHA